MLAHSLTNTHAHARTHTHAELKKAEKASEEHIAHAGGTKAARSRPKPHTSYLRLVQPPLALLQEL